ncbi:MAG TPA: cell division protein FtsA [Bacteroidales bacterium]|nr:cell division protein FtsA [Bacteroidales bacterium]
MSSNNIISVIDIGTTKIVALVGKKEENGTFSILGLGHVESRGVTRGNVLNIIETVKSIKTAVEIAEKQAGTTISEVYVGIAGQNIECIVNADYLNRNKSEEEISQEELDYFIKSQENISLKPGQQILQVIPKHFEIDGEVVENPVGCIGKRLDAKFHLIIGLTQNINSIKRCIANAGLRLKKIILEPIASAKAVLHPEEIEAGVAMIDIGGGTSDLAIYHKNMLVHTAVIPFGGNVVTSDIEKAFGLTNKDAERLKIAYGKALPEKNDSEEVVVIESKIQGREKKEIDLNNISNIIQARVEEILGFINQQIMLADGKKHIGIGIVLTGGGSLLKNMPQLTSYCTAFESRIGYPLVHINQNSQKLMNNPQYATAIGLLILGSEEENKKTIEKKTEIKQEEKATISVTDDFEEVINEKKKKEKKETTPKEIKQQNEKKPGIIEKFKGVFSGIFDDTDSNI